MCTLDVYEYECTSTKKSSSTGTGTSTCTSTVVDPMVLVAGRHHGVDTIPVQLYSILPS